MVIDFHAHVFPDELAPKALASLVASIDNLYKPVTDMTVHGLLCSMDRCGVDISVNQPVVTRETQVEKTNRWVKDIENERLYSFGGIFPNSDNYKDDIDLVCSLGLKGLKLHPEYQNFQLDDSRMLKIYDYALGKGLILLFHAGDDPGFSAPYKSSPRQFARIADELRGGVIVAAHLGGHANWDDVEHYLTGKNVYLDTSMGFEYFSREQFLRIVKAHGSDKILFASDSPWSDAKTEIEYIKALPLPKNELDNILYLNAKRLLAI